MVAFLIADSTSFNGEASFVEAEGVMTLEGEVAFEEELEDSFFSGVFCC